jgi:hypothetical protein
MNLTTWTKRSALAAALVLSAFGQTFEVEAPAEARQQGLRPRVAFRSQPCGQADILTKVKTATRGIKRSGPATKPKVL